MNDVNGTEAIMRVGSDPEPADRGARVRLGARPPGDQPAHRVRASPALTKGRGDRSDLGLVGAAVVPSSLRGVVDVPVGPLGLRSFMS